MHPAHEYKGVYVLRSSQVTSCCNAWFGYGGMQSKSLLVMQGQDKGRVGRWVDSPGQTWWASWSRVRSTRADSASGRGSASAPGTTSPPGSWAMASRSLSRVSAWGDVMARLGQVNHPPKRRQYLDGEEESPVLNFGTFVTDGCWFWKGSSLLALWIFSMPLH